jgi:hypothetical protein
MPPSHVGRSPNPRLPKVVPTVVPQQIGKDAQESRLAIPEPESTDPQPVTWSLNVGNAFLTCDNGWL